MNYDDSGYIRCCSSLRLKVMLRTNNCGNSCNDQCIRCCPGPIGPRGRTGTNGPTGPYVPF